MQARGQYRRADEICSGSDFDRSTAQEETTEIQMDFRGNSVVELLLSLKLQEYLLYLIEIGKRRDLPLPDKRA